MKRVLLVSHLPPSKEHAGGQRLLDLYSELKCICPDLHLALITCSVHGFDKDLLKEIFDEVHCVSGNRLSVQSLLMMEFDDSDFDLVDLQYHQAGSLIGASRKRWPSAVLIFAPMESQVRALKIAFTRGKWSFWQAWKNTLGLLRSAMLEACYVIRADKVVTVSDRDRDTLSFLKPMGRVISIPTSISPREVSAHDTFDAPSGSETIVFFAYFGSRTNREALCWFIHEVHPAICRVLPNYRFRLVGHGIDESLLRVCSVEQVEVIGSVSTIADALQGAAVGISPALSGAGARGKIHQYASLGLPCVASPIACEGLSYKNRESIFIANTSRDFSEACIALLQDEKLRERVRANAIRVCRTYYQWPVWRPEIISTYELSNDLAKEAK